MIINTKDRITKKYLLIIVLVILVNILPSYADNARYDIEKLGEKKISIKVFWDDKNKFEGIGLLYYKLINAKTLYIGYEEKLGADTEATIEYDISGSIMPIRVVLKREDQSSLIFKDVIENEEYEYISHLYGAGVINGRPDGSFGSYEGVTRAEFVAMLLRSLGYNENWVNGIENNSNKFRDINGHWGEKYLLIAAQKGLINGYPDGTMKPDKTVSFAEVSKMIDNSYKFNTKVNKLFSKLKVGMWYSSCVKRMFDAGVVNEVDRVYQNFNEDRAIDRATTAIMISRAMSTW